jgi:cytidine deaminase
LDASERPVGAAELVEAARAARDRAIAPYSKFRVGAALLTADGHVIVAGNIENASYGLTTCAERVALLKALSDGHRAFSMIAVVADTAAPTPPCGPCRQLLWEYCGDIPVIMANLTTVTATLQLATLLPMPFDRRLL